MYTDPYFDSSTGTGTMASRRWLSCASQGSFCDVSSWDLLYLETPKKPDSASCGVCVLIMNGLMATEDVEAFYLLNEQFQ